MAWEKFIQTGTFDPHAYLETRLCRNRSREMYSPIRRSTRKQGNTSAFDRNISPSGARRQIIIKEEGSKEDRQEEGGVKINVKNVYIDVKQRH